jgi:hypothetical protein
MRRCTMAIRLPRAALFLLAGLAGCPQPEVPECTEFEEVFVWADEDGDGFGQDTPIGYVCKAEPGQATNMADCDDAEPTVFPGAEEVCDLLDNNCNDRIDEDQPKLRWYHDTDGDGFGNGQEAVLECVAPDATWILQAGDCDDGSADINPLVQEICDDIDNDCDKLTDDEDGGVDPTTYIRWFADNDGDSFGDPLNFEDRCVSPAGYVLDASDCDDNRADINPLGLEICNNRDDDCDTLTDDADPSIDTTTQTELFADVDGDGYGDVNSPVLVCRPTPGLGVLDSSDCDDTDPLANVDQDWYEDLDSDGYGSGSSVVFQCLNPGGGLVPLGAGLDCNDAEPTIHPDALDVCNDGVDVDCSGSDQCGSCKEWQTALSTNAVTGVYTVEPTVGVIADVYCDMDTDGGGWTLVASSRNTLDDAGTYTISTDLQTLEPTGFTQQLWAGMRPWVFVNSQGRTDIRFACKNNLTGAFDVDLSFYNTIWYYEVTFGSDLQSCFNENTGMGADPPPERRNNITGATLAAGNPWNATGYLEGEDSCGDSGDFTVDFDDRGMDSNQSDGTDWGEDDGSFKCGTSAAGQAYFIFIRE